MKCVAVVYVLVGLCFSGAAKEERPLSVLLISSPFAGHLASLVAVGEELVDRGHHVTLFTTEVRGSNVVPQLPERVGIKFLSAGVDALSRQEYEAAMFNLREKNLLETVKLTLNLSAGHLLQMRIGADNLHSEDYDILLFDFFAVSIGMYLSEKWGARMIMNMRTPLLTSSQPAFPFPYYTYYSASDNMTFLQRLINTAIHAPLTKAFAWLAKKSVLEVDDVVANAVCEDPKVFVVTIPTICYTAFGIEYPRPLPPMVHFVGPAVMKSFPPIEDRLQQWLNEKPDRKVVYISMGSTAFLTPQMGKAIIEGILATNYDVVWSLRETNRDILEGVQLDKGRFFISRWVSQQAVLQHKAVAMAILHGGLNGVQEAIYYTVPVITIPFGMDQGMVASKLYHQGLGIQITSSELTAERVTSSIKAIETGDYRQRVEKLSQIFRFAGGAKAAADLVEFYADVGYDHLVPAFLKYKWSWVQYYNVDVYALLTGILLLVIFVSYRAMRCLCRKCCHRGGKIKAD